MQTFKFDFGSVQITLETSAPFQISAVVCDAINTPINDAINDIKTFTAVQPDFKDVTKFLRPLSVKVFNDKRKTFRRIKAIAFRKEVQALASKTKQRFPSLDVTPVFVHRKGAPSYVSVIMPL